MDKKVFDQMFSSIKNVDSSSQSQEAPTVFEEQFSSRKVKNKSEAEKNKISQGLTENTNKLRSVAVKGSVDKKTKIVVHPGGVFATIFTKIKGKDSGGEGGACEGLHKSKGIKMKEKHNG